MADNRKTVSFKCSEDEATKYKEFAEKMKMTQSDLLRAALADYMRQHDNDIPLNNDVLPKHYAARVNYMFNRR